MQTVNLVGVADTADACRKKAGGAFDVPAFSSVDDLIAEGVDEEPIEGNRRLFEGGAYLAIAAVATIYAAFHMLALNGVSISNMTGIDIPFLPQFPMETWNFRIVHIAGALALGFLLFSAHSFAKHGDDAEGNRLVSIGAAALGIPALIAGVTAIGFANTINSGELPEMGGLTTWAAFPGTDIYEAEVRWFGIPLLIATFGNAGSSHTPTFSCRSVRRWSPSILWRSMAQRPATRSAPPSCPSGSPSPQLPVRR